MYGGSPNPTPPDADQIYILSLPSFTWFKADYPPRAGRIHHTCHAVNNQLVAIGGLDPLASGDYNGTADPWPQGLGIFDMNALVWKDSFNGTAPKYTPPDIVTQYIKKWVIQFRADKNPASSTRSDSVLSSNSMYPANWSSDAVRELFMNASSTSHKLSDGDIAGIAISIVVLVVAVAAILFYFYRKKARSKSMANIAEKDSEPGSPIQEVDGDDKRIEVAANKDSTTELNSRGPPMEVHADALPVEMPTHSSRVVESVSPVEKRQNGQSFERQRDGGDSFQTREGGESFEIGEGRELNELVSPIEPEEGRFGGLNRI